MWAVVLGMLQAQESYRGRDSIESMISIIGICQSEMIRNRKKPINGRQVKSMSVSLFRPTTSHIEVYTFLLS